MRSGGLDIVVIDSVAALTPKAEIEGEVGASYMGFQARLMSQALRKLTAITAKSKLSSSSSIKSECKSAFSSVTRNDHRRALKFYSSVKDRSPKSRPDKKGEEVIGI